MQRKKSVFTLLLLLLCLALLAPAAMAEDEVTFTIVIMMDDDDITGGCCVRVTPEGGESVICGSSWEELTFPVGTSVSVEAVPAPGWRILNWIYSPEDALSDSAVRSYTVSGTEEEETVSFYPSFGRGEADTHSVAIGEGGLALPDASVTMTFGVDYSPEIDAGILPIALYAPETDLYFTAEGTTLGGSDPEAFHVRPFTGVLGSGWASSIEIRPAEGLAPGIYSAVLTINDRDGMLAHPATVPVEMTVADLSLSAETAAAVHDRFLPAAIEGRPWSFTFVPGEGVSTDGWTLESMLTEGLVFTDNADGTATISGTPAVSSGAAGLWISLVQEHGGADAVSVRRKFRLVIYPDSVPQLYVTADGSKRFGGSTDYTDTALPFAYEDRYYYANVYLDTLLPGQSWNGEMILLEKVEGKAFPAFLSEGLYDGEFMIEGMTAPGDYAFTARSVRTDSDGETILSSSEKRLFTLHCAALPRLKEDGFLKHSVDGSLYAPVILIGEPYSFTFGTQSELPVTVSLDEIYSNVPQGLTLRDNGDGTATISGTVEEADYGCNVSCVIESAAGQTSANIGLAITKSAKVEILLFGEEIGSDTLPVSAAGAEYPETMICGNQDGGLECALSVSGAVPSFFEQDGPTYVYLSGTVAAEDEGEWTMTFTWTIFNVDGTPFDSDSRTVTLRIYPELSSDRTWSDSDRIEIPLLYAGEEMTPVALAPYLSGGSGQMRFSVEPVHEEMWYEGLTLDEESGVISGTPAAEAYGTELIVRAEDIATGQEVDLGLRFEGVAAARPDPDKTPQGYVERAYALILGREGDAEGIAHWTSSLADGTSAGAIISEFFRSEEYRSRGLSDAETVTLCYRAMLSREPDAAGLDNWTALLKDGYSTTKLVSEFVASDEFQAICAEYGLTAGTITLTERDRNSSITRFIMRCYGFALDRDADEAGLNEWCAHLLDQDLTAERVAFGFVFSDEAKARGLSDWAFIEMLYRMMLDREADAGIGSWLEALAAQTDAEIAWAHASGERTEDEARDQARQAIYARFAASEEFAQMVANFGM